MVIIWPASLTEGAKEVKVKAMETRGKRGSSPGADNGCLVMREADEKQSFGALRGAPHEGINHRLVGSHLSVVPVETGEPH
jgi:hypothetical protein